MAPRATDSQEQRYDIFAATRLEQVFADCFAEKWRARLTGGAAEPLYQPAAGEGDYHLLHYRSDYFASALHEVAHWCLAGEARRQLPDFGYWYAPDGRSPAQQRAFESVEYKPQALEWWFSKACGYRFKISIDNLHCPDPEPGDPDSFKRRIFKQANDWQYLGLPPRAHLFFDGLCREFGSLPDPEKIAFTLAELD